MTRGRVQVLSVGAGYAEQAIGVVNELQRLAGLVPNWSWARAAVIARNWDALSPVRSYCELQGIPVQWAAEEQGSFWRYREVQALVDWLREEERRLVQASLLREWLAGRPEGPYWAALREAVEEYGLESGEQDQPVHHFIEWLVEWCRDVRRRQTGLLLLTAHRAKGLEFDHVAVLDGEWTRRSGWEDPDAPRRLYYVAMTRARQSLVLARMEGRGRMVDAQQEGPELMSRSAPPPEVIAPEVYRVRWRLTPAEVDLSFAGRYGERHLVHGSIGRLSAGDLLELRHQCDKWNLYDQNGDLVGRLARSFALNPDMRCRSAHVAAILTRFEEDSVSTYRAQLRCSRWEVVVPQLLFEPEVPPSAGCARREREMPFDRERFVADR